MEIDIPEERLILSDYDTWSVILLNGLLADTEEEDELQEKEYEAMPRKHEENTSTGTGRMCSTWPMWITAGYTEAIPYRPPSGSLEKKT